jgi:aryl-alcohol dehydrogenase-like predicted oxidoreductase
MENRTLGNTGIQVSPLGLGTVKIGRNQNVKYPTTFELPDDQAVRNLLAQARELGINLLDTAPAYGNSQARLGQLLTRRHDWIIVSKVGEQYAQGQSTYDFSYQATLQTVQNSLRTLRTDYLDLVLIHSDGNDQDILTNTDCVAALEQLKQQGQIRAHGLSGKTVAGGLLALEQQDVVMVSYNPEDISQQPVIQQAAATNKGVLIKKGLNSGHQTNTTAAIQHSLRQPGVSSLIIGTLNPNHLQHNVEAAACG